MPPVVAYWALAILALSLLIIVHEAGHFVAAKIGRMHVDRFSVLGIGPVVVRLFKYKGTEYVLSAIPFGAYVHIVGMEAEDDEEEEEEDDEEDDEEGDDPGGEAEAATRLPEGHRNFRDSPIGYRMFALAGGPLANYLTAMLIMIGVFLFVGMKTPTEAVISGFRGDSPAEAAGLAVDDVLVSVAGESVRGEGVSERLRKATDAHLGETVDVTVLRDGEPLTVPVELNDVQPALATDLAMQGEFVPVSPLVAIVEGAKWPWTQTAFQLRSLAALVTGKQEGKVGGPVAIAREIKTSAERGIVEFVVFCALISTVLGMFNLLPFPALDGGRLIFQIYELVLRRPPNKVLEERVHMVGMLALLALLVYATFGDIRGDGPPSWGKAVNEVKSEIIEAESKAKAAAGQEPSGS